MTIRSAPPPVSYRGREVAVSHNKHLEPGSDLPCSVDLHGVDKLIAGTNARVFGYPGHPPRTKPHFRHIPEGAC